MDKKKQHFVMVHGVGHGAWCWFKLQHLLESSGHKVSCLDLAGAGISTKDPNSVLSFDDYHQPLYDFDADKEVTGEENMKTNAWTIDTDKEGTGEENMKISTRGNSRINRGVPGAKFGDFWMN